MGPKRHQGSPKASQNAFLGAFGIPRSPEGDPMTTFGCAVPSGRGGETPPRTTVSGTPRANQNQTRAYGGQPVVREFCPCWPKSKGRSRQIQRNVCFMFLCLVFQTEVLLCVPASLAHVFGIVLAFWEPASDRFHPLCSFRFPFLSLPQGMKIQLVPLILKTGRETMPKR